MRGAPELYIEKQTNPLNQQAKLVNLKVISVKGSKFSRFLWTAAGVLLGIHLLGVALIDVAKLENEWVIRFFHMFHLDREQNVATGFSTFLLFFAGTLLALITFLQWKNISSFRYLWALLSGGFCFMAVDEAWSFHERLVKPIRAVTHNELPTIFHFAWVLPAVILILFLGIVFFKFLLKLPTKTRTTFIFAAFLYLGGAVGMEMIGGNYAASEGQSNLPYVLLTTLEESLEICGVLVFIGGLFHFIRNNFQYLKLEFH